MIIKHSRDGQKVIAREQNRAIQQLVKQLNRRLAFKKMEVTMQDKTLYNSQISDYRWAIVVRDNYKKKDANNWECSYFEAMTYPEIVTFIMGYREGIESVTLQAID